MTHPLGEAVLVVPDRDAARPEDLTALEQALRERDVAYRRAPAATARHEIGNGARYLVHCGGQRSLVGWLPAAVGTEVVVGIFPGGAPNDFARTFGLELHAEAAATLLASERLLRVDVGVCTIAGRDTYVFNHAVVGLGAGRGGRGPRALLGWYRDVLLHRRTRYDVDMTFAEYHAPATQVRLANGQWALGGLQAAPTALPDDGAWDVQVWAGPRSLPFALQPRMLRGEHLPHEHVMQWRQKRAQVVATPPARVAIDDVIVGRTPATFEIRPKALRLKI
jgi:diacylglycerol kinase family enzyme